ncbi:GntR family transcriptional regulator [Amantichitinum ursilacus]|uniref:Putative HTH-type transcriptional regulator YdfH n=1 Tax=Amantichitinum ursilacus TaxID=857265 RepID=A0A0N0XGK2_9NEIS|nr:GntR family transcriptional regulator [Amantichitinum ursilacus]KPC50132.1 putative HTH-type transcriptional regulator YdfH [Amantichitinum ursilacus]
MKPESLIDPIEPTPAAEAASVAAPRRRGAADNLANRVYAAIKTDIMEFRLLPGDRFTESEVAERLSASRTPVREALYRLQAEHFVEVQFRNGWQVRPFDFDYFEDLYDVRIILELAAVRRLCERVTDAPVPELEALKAIWLVPVGERITDGVIVSGHDENFHSALVAATGNGEMARIHREVTEKIRPIRRLDFTKPYRVDTTYHEHGAILRAIVQRRSDEAQRMLKAHIDESKAEVRKITLHMMHAARRRGEESS